MFNYIDKGLWDLNRDFIVTLHARTYTVWWAGQTDAVPLVAAGSDWKSITWSSFENAAATIAEPFNATTPLTNAGSIDGGVVVIERGGNDFLCVCNDARGPNGVSGGADCTSFSQGKPFCYVDKGICSDGGAARWGGGPCS